MIAGKFDPIHDGHIDHILKASALGDYLIVTTHTDDIVRKLKGRCEVPLWARMVLLKGILSLYHISGEVRLSIDEDGKSVRTLEMLHPEVFAKGGDRTPDNMPAEELEVCGRLGIKVIYGVGEPLNKSSGIKIHKEDL